MAGECFILLIPLPPIPLPIFWQTALSDTWQLNWSPLPLSVSKQFHHAKDQVWGFTIGTGVGYASNLGLVLAPALQFYQRTKIGPAWAWETAPDFSFEYTSKPGQFDWSVGLMTGPLFQITEHFALAPKVGVNVSYGYRNLISISDVTVAPPRQAKFTVPVSLAAKWSLARQWDFNATYSLYAIGYTNGYMAHLGSLRLVHFW